MIETLCPILPKTPVLGLRLHVGRSGLCIGDPAELCLSETGELAIYAPVNRRFLGLVPYRRDTELGHLAPRVARLLAPAVAGGHPLRVRIVGITPEHLSGPNGPELHVSVWGDPLILTALRKSETARNPSSIL